MTEPARPRREVPHLYTHHDALAAIIESQIEELLERGTLNGVRLVDPPTAVSDVEHTVPEHTVPEHTGPDHAIEGSGHSSRDGETADTSGDGDGAGAPDTSR